MGQGHSLPRTVEGEDIRSNVTCTVLLRISEVASHFTPICGASSRAKRCCLPWRDTHTHSHRHTHRTGPAKDTNRLLPPPQSKDVHAHARSKMVISYSVQKWLVFHACQLDGSVLSLSHSCSLTPAGRLSLFRRHEFSIGRIQSNRQQVYQESNEYSIVFACEVQIGFFCGFVWVFFF